MIKWENLNHSFNKKTLYNNFTLEVKKGEKIIIKGESGSGKSTLFKIALGLLIPESGNVFVNNIELKQQTVAQIRQEIYYLDQEINLPYMEVSEVISEIFSYKGNRDKTYTNDQIFNLMNSLKLEKEIYRKNIKDLSGGERQRIGIIIGILLDRPIWLLDEPTSSVDKDLKDIVYKKITSLNSTIIVTSHDDCWNNLKQIKWSKK